MTNLFIFVRIFFVSLFVVVVCDFQFGNTLLHFCSSPIAIRVLVAHGAHVNLPNHDGDSPLMTAAYLGNLDAVNLLLKRGADPLLQNMAGDTALSMAEFLNHQDVVLAIREETSLFN
eukprot:c19437_g1_i7.p1 GENE.c19437_g1_i7~~c19437_g1_i7.p1  ORF type:complete len:117 (+),score=22.58 c19437_g1_i7:173-523(+)